MLRKRLPRFISVLNRWLPIDSSIALDVRGFARDNEGMESTDKFARHKLQMLVLKRRDASRNMARFYVLALEPALFDDTALTREWGCIGSLRRRRLELHIDPDAAAETLEVWLARKHRRGYRVLP